MPGTAHEHFDQSVDNANPYIDACDWDLAVTSLIVDLGLHPGTVAIANSSALTVLSLGTMNDPKKYREALESLKAKML